MKNQKKIILLFCFFVTINASFSQLVFKTGSLFSEVSDIIFTMPSDSGNHYQEPSSMELEIWENALNALINKNYPQASDFANLIDYQLINFTDTTSIPHQNYYILEAINSNYWGTYVYNPNYCRSLVIQAPHAKKDANTGYQGIHVFIETNAMFYQVNGTHRCNSTSFSSCSGTTTSCSSSSEAYRISDLAHNTTSIFQKTTEVLFNSFDDTYFIQLHGFTKLNTDPYIILSNGSQDVPAVDYFPSLKANLYLEDTSLTFKIAHIDTNWTRLRGFWNTQGRLINNSSSHCNHNASSTSGRFFHIEQERIRMRIDENAWDKMANALKNTFECIVDPTPISIENLNINQRIKIYPNPTKNDFTIESKLNLNKEHLMFNLLGENVSSQISISILKVDKTTIRIHELPTGVYFLRIENKLLKILKND